MWILTTVFFIFASAVTEKSCVVLSFPPRDKSVAATLHATAALDSRYESWPDPSRILYYIDKSYSDLERLTIQAAMLTIATDMTRCIQFQEYVAGVDTGKSYIFISKTLNDGTTPPTCVTFFGRVMRAGAQGQKMVIHNGPNGCMGSVREVMKVLVNALGLRNEYRRPDRDRYLVVTQQNMVPELQGSTLLTPYNESEVYYSFPFDYHSLTILPNNKYAMASKTIYSYPSNIEIPDLDYLSLNDCLGLSWMYGCDVKQCKDPYVMPAPATALPAPSGTPGPSNISGGNSMATPNTGLHFVLLSPDSGSSVNSSTADSSATLFRVVASNGTSNTSMIFGTGQVPNNVVSDSSAAGRVNIAVTYSMNSSSGDVRNFVLDKNMTLANMAQSSGPMTLHLQNLSNSTAYVGISGPPGFTGSFIVALNNTAVVFNSTIMTSTTNPTNLSKGTMKTTGTIATDTMAPIGTMATGSVATTGTMKTTGIMAPGTMAPIGTMVTGSGATTGTMNNTSTMATTGTMTTGTMTMKSMSDLGNVTAATTTGVPVMNVTAMDTTISSTTRVVPLPLLVP